MKNLKTWKSFNEGIDEPISSRAEREMQEFGKQRMREASEEKRIREELINPGDTNSVLVELGIHEVSFRPGTANNSAHYGFKTKEDSEKFQEFLSNRNIKFEIKTSESPGARFPFHVHISK